jgi:hypothetical protein
MAVTVFANVTTASRGYFLLVDPDRYRVSTVIAHHLGRNLRSQSLPVKKPADI